MHVSNKMLFTESLQQLVDTRYSCFSTRVKKDKQTFLERGYFTRFRDDSRFYRWHHFNGNIMVSNNITIVFWQAFQFSYYSRLYRACIQNQFSGQCDLRAFSFLAGFWANVGLQVIQIVDNLTNKFERYLMRCLVLKIVQINSNFPLCAPLKIILSQLKRTFLWISFFSACYSTTVNLGICT